MVEFEICAEMQKLRNYLNENNIPWEDGSEDKPMFWMCRTRFDIGDRNFSVINGYGSYGGLGWHGKNQGLLECWINQKGEPEGYLTADEIIAKILGK